MSAFDVIVEGVWYLDLQDIITTDALVMHLMVGIVSISAGFVFNKSEAAKLVSINS